MNNVLILGGYGNFGKRIAVALVRHNVPVVIAGRSLEKAQLLKENIHKDYSDVDITAVALDAEKNLEDYLKHQTTSVVINTCGPFQNKNYNVAESCIRQRTHYIDLADGREFVAGIKRLDAAAKEAGTCVISGASTVPGLSSAVVEYYKPEFSQIEQMTFGISPGQKAERGLATTAGILSYIGKPLKPSTGSQQVRYGWQDIYRQKYPVLGYRWMANCDIPDMDLFPEYYGIRKIHFSAGMENTLLHLGIWGLSWLIRAGLPINLQQHASFLLRTSHFFDRFGSDAGGMHIILKGKSPEGYPHERRWFIIGKDGDGPQIPCVPAILLAKKLANGFSLTPGARACIGLIKLQEYLEELSRFSVTTY